MKPQKPIGQIISFEDNPKKKSFSFAIEIPDGRRWRGFVNKIKRYNTEFPFCPKI